MANIRVLVPQESKNYVENPSIRTDTTGYTAIGSTVTRSLDRARFGVSSLKIVTNGNALYEGVYYRANKLSGINSPITASVYVRGAGAVRVRLIEGDREWYSKAVFLTDTEWKRIFISGRSSGSNDVRIYVETDKSVSIATFYADGFQIEPFWEMTTYIDGDQPGCRWNIKAHSTISSRNAYTREGGRWIAVAGPCREQDDIYATGMEGLGYPPIRLNKQSYAELPGSYFQNTKILDRPFTINFHTKKKQLPSRRKPELSPLHGLRKQLIEIFKSDAVRNNQEFIFEYEENGRALYIKARYDSGLEGNWDIRNQWINSFPVRFISLSPYFFEDNQQIYSLDFQQDFTGNYVIGRIDGKWQNLNGGVDSIVEGMAVGKDDEIYVVGDYLQVNVGGIAPYVQVSASFISYWDGYQFKRVGTGMGAGSRINSVAIAPNGYIFVTGLFSSIGGVAATNAAYHDGSNWNAMGTGLNAEGLTVKVAPDGQAYFGGLFTSADGVVAYYIARWDGSSFHSIGLYGGLNSYVYTMDITKDGTTIYIGGNFTDEFSLSSGAHNYVTSYIPDTNTFSALGTGMDNVVYGIKVAPDNTVYAVGNFSTAGGDLCYFVAQWNLTIWLPLGDGLDNTAYSLGITSDGLIWVAGVFTQAGGVYVDQFAIYNGYSWVNTDVVISGGGSTIYSIATPKNGDIYVGGDGFNGTTTKAAEITEVENTGSAEISPIIYIVGPASLKWIENQTNVSRLFFNLDILSGEEVFIDFGRGTITSETRGDLLYSLLPGSDFRKFGLLPGTNKISVFMMNDTDAIMKIFYKPKHWSADYISNEESL